MSEDSDYTSDINYPVGQQANSSASQFLGVANQMSTPQRSLENSRENSYEREDPAPLQHHHYGGGLEETGYAEGYGDGYEGYGDYYDNYTLEHNRKNESHLIGTTTTTTAATTTTTTTTTTTGADEGLFYNSRPNNRKDYSEEF
ncbi:hypothetical protein Pcinc_020284 [Petrolisthes cinctipes]|uniref:Uncharacterized protein n=1 Tax=Petrolisthes cinctipes TaxID=88211 RepID=A0AAE1FJF9_PETCI|nr:hypothetical protein Pcinc_020284 [Petrolisthes cinctipes]